MLSCNLAIAPRAHGYRVRPGLHRRDDNRWNPISGRCGADVGSLALTLALRSNRNLLELIARRLTLRQHRHPTHRHSAEADFP